MLNTKNTIELISKLVDMLKIREIVVGLLIAGVFILFAPVKFLDILGLQVWRDTYRSHVGTVVLICFILCLIWIMVWIRNKIVYSAFSYMKISRSYLKKTISTEEQAFLIRHFYNIELGEFNSTAELDITSGNVALLQNAYIISRASNLSTRGASRWAYFLQPNVRIFLNRAIKRKRIVVDGNKFTWKL